MVLEVAGDHCIVHLVVDVVHLLWGAVYGIMGMGVVPTVLRRRSSEGTHGHGEAPGEAPTRENGKTGRSPNLGILDSEKWTLSWIGFCSWEGLKRRLQP